MRYEKVSRIAGLISAALVATVTFAIAAHAVQTTTTPNAITVAYSLSPDTDSGGITPPTSVPVLVIADQNSIGDVGSTALTIVNAPGGGSLVWNGLESNAGGVTSGATATPGAHIVFIDFGHEVSLVVNTSTSFRVRNRATGIAKGNVTLIW